jgi:ABC-type nickel/cobalt efflux system permease component RcnA
MDWRLIGKILFVLSAFPWAIFLYTLFNLDALGLTLDSFWPMTELVVALLMTVIGFWLAVRK